MSMIPANALSSCHWRSGHTQVRAAREDAVGLDRRRVAARAARRRLGAGPRSSRSTACGAGESTCGITSPARRTITSSPTRRSLRARSSSLCSVASLTVTPPTWTGSSTANGCRSPNLPTFHWMSFSQRDRGGRRELPRDRPARVAPDHAEAALQLEVVDLDDDAVDLEVERAAALLPAPGTGRRPRPRLSSRLTSPLTRKPCARSHSSASQCEPSVQPLGDADRVAPHRQRPLGGERGVELADRPRRRVARVHERRQARPRRGARSAPRSRGSDM